MSCGAHVYFAGLTACVCQCKVSTAVVISDQFFQRVVSYMWSWELGSSPTRRIPWAGAVSQHRPSLMEMKLGHSRYHCHTGSYAEQHGDSLMQTVWHVEVEAGKTLLKRDLAVKWCHVRGVSKDKLWGTESATSGKTKGSTAGLGCVISSR